MSESREWRPIEGFPDYQVSNLGDVRSIDRVSCGRRLKGRDLAPGMDSKGYRQVGLYRDKARLTRRVHTLVCAAFNPAPAEGQTLVAHYDGDPLNNHAGNLRWATPAENYADEVRHGTSNRGERQGLSKLTSLAVQSVRARYDAGGVTQRQLAIEHGVEPSAICSVISGKNWGHIACGDAAMRDCRTKVTSTAALEIRRRYGAGGVTQRELGLEYGVAQTTISYVVRRPEVCQ